MKRIMLTFTMIVAVMVLCCVEMSGQTDRPSGLRGAAPPLGERSASERERKKGMRLDVGTAMKNIRKSTTKADEAERAATNPPARKR